MKNKWTVTWWNDNTDSVCKKGFKTYVEALEFQQRMIRKTGRTNVQIK